MSYQARIILTIEATDRHTASVIARQAVEAAARSVAARRGQRPPCYVDRITHTPRRRARA